MAIRERKVEHEDDRAGAEPAPREIIGETLPAPWEAEDYVGADGCGRQRHDAFTLPRRQAFLKTLTKTGCILDACRATGVSKSTVYNLQDSDEEFSRHCRLAVDMANVPVELAAWERGVTGIEEEVIRGGKVVGTRLKRSDSILRLLLQGSNRKKYGPRPGFSRKRLMQWERKQMEREIRAAISQDEPPIEQVREDIMRRIDNIRRHEEPARLAAGWTKMKDGDLVPPGWTWSGDTGDEAIDQYGPVDDS
jgi:hypothetical protein